MSLEKVLLVVAGVLMAVGLGAVIADAVAEREEIIQNPTGE